MENSKAYNNFVNRCREIHGYNYDYSHFNYVDYRTPSWIICNKCGCAFKQSPNKHLSKKRGCQICRTIEANKKKRKTTEEFIARVNKIFNGFYIYDKTEYVKAKEKVIITCPIHGDFKIKPNDHLNGHGCAKCCKSRLEVKMSLFLTKNNIEFEEQKRFDWLINKSHLSLDFYLPKYNIAIECQGDQHYSPIEHFGGEEEFKKIKERDNAKSRLCKENGVKLIYFKYGDDIEKFKRELNEYIQ